MTRSKLASICQRCQSQPSFRPSNPSSRAFSTATTRSKASEISIFEQALGRRAPNTTTTTAAAAAAAVRNPSSQSTSPAGFRRNTRNSGLESLAQGARDEASTRPSSGVSDDEPYHLNVYTHRHNVHITFTEPSRNPIMSYSGGNIGLKHAQRGTFDAAYQLSTYTMRKMVERQWRIGGKGMTMNKMLTLNEPEVKERGIEVVLRGFGVGREAFQKALLGNEGKLIKPLIKKVTDSTRLKFGGTRSPQVRRLG